MRSLAEQGKEVKSKKKIIVIIGIIMLVLMVTMGGAYVGYKVVLSNVDPDSLAEKNLPKYSYNMGESFVINLAGNGRYVRVGIVLEYTDKKLTEELENINYKLKDTTISFFRSKNIEQIEDISQVKSELQKVYNSDLKENEGITDIYFTEFIIQ